MDFSIKYFKDYISFHVDDSHPVKELLLILAKRQMSKKRKSAGHLLIRFPRRASLRS